MIDFSVPGTPKGKGRPKFVKATGRAYTPAGTVDAEGDVVGAWARAGEVTLEDAPFKLELMAVLTRPQGHWRKDGSLNKTGLGSYWPTKKPDLDNIQKLILDALQSKAFSDDKNMVHSVTWKRWANPGEPAHVRVRLMPMSPPARGVA